MAETQQVIPGTADVPTARVESAGREYCELLSQRMATQKAEDEARATLIEYMKEDEIERFEVDGREVKRVKTEVEKIKVKTLQKETE